MAASEIWITPNGAPSLTLEGKKPKTSSKRDWYEKTFPSQTIHTSNLTTRDHKGTETSWPFDGQQWQRSGGTYNSAWADRVIIGLDVKKEKRGTYTIGPTGAMTNDNETGSWQFDVVGVSFVYDRNDCYWKTADIRIDRVGIRYWDIDTKKEIVEIATLKDSGGNHPPNVADKDGTRDASPALAVYDILHNASALTHMRSNRIVCIGFHIQLRVYTDGNYGGSSHWHKFSICELAPIHKSQLDKAKTMAPLGNWKPNDKSMRIG